MKFTSFFLLFLTFSLSLSNPFREKYSSPRNSYQGQCCSDLDHNPNIDKNTNFVCNGDFQEPSLGTKTSQFFPNGIKCWKTSGIVDLKDGKTLNPELTSQALQLDPKDKVSENNVLQIIDLPVSGLYELQFQYATRTSIAIEQNSFHVYFNGRKVLEVRPGLSGVFTETETLEGKKGSNSLQFVYKGKPDGQGALIDNIKLYSWKSNKICGINEIEAVGAGGIVTYSTFYDQKHMGYQLDRNNFGAHAWCPLYGKTVGEWIQISAGDIKLWNSVIVQGRGDYINSATSFKLSYSIDGFEWFEYEDGKIYSLPADRNIKTRFNIDPVYATVLRLTFMSYSGTHVCVRFGATYFVNS